MTKPHSRRDVCKLGFGNVRSALRLAEEGDPEADGGGASQPNPVANTDRLFELAFAIYRSLLTCSDTRDRLAEGEEPGDLHHELATRSLLAARIFWAEARREL